MATSSSADDLALSSDSDGAGLSSGDLKVSPSPRPRRPRSSSRHSPKNGAETPSQGKRRGKRSGTGPGYTQAPAAGKIFRNLLILEASLRDQVAHQRGLRRKYLTFLAILCLMSASIAHNLYIADALVLASGPLRLGLQFVLLALLVTLILYHLSGEYNKTIVRPRKFLAFTNRGLRQFHVKLVRFPASYVDGTIETIRELLLYAATSSIDCLHHVSSGGPIAARVHYMLAMCQLICQPRYGLNDVKLVLIAREFTINVREAWELYRTEFWTQEGQRRRQRMQAFIATLVSDPGSLPKSPESSPASPQPTLDDHRQVFNSPVHIRSPSVHLSCPSTPRNTKMHE